ncbi:hypothetical protein HNV12_04330 [Methanococcoides sp. SA1]|nr:hypothetical protein [Methanococcoides sp. SA1]
MILVINVCKEGFHYFEFVKPVEDVLRSKGIVYQTFHYKQLSEELLEKASRVIICGTSLFDMEYMEDLDEFEWLKKFKKPVLGICAGMHIIGRVFGERVYKNKEIGFFRGKFEKEFLGLKGEVEVYLLHNNYAKFSKSKFILYGEGKAALGVKKKGKEIYGVLFHPEVRNKDLILRFVRGNGKK